MSTQEDRLATLERKVAAMELQRLYDERKALENTPSEQAHNYSEINHNLAMLLGIAPGQEHAIRLMQGDLGIIRERAEHQGEDIRAIKDDLGIIKERIEQRFTSLEGKFEQVLQHLAALTAKLE